MQPAAFGGELPIAQDRDHRLAHGRAIDAAPGNSAPCHRDVTNDRFWLDMGNHPKIFVSMCIILLYYIYMYHIAYIYVYI